MFNSKMPGRLSTLSWRAIEFFFLLAVFSLPFSVSLAEIGFITALALWFLRKFPFGEKFAVVPRLAAPYSFFVVFIILSITQAGPEHWSLGARGLLKWIKYLGIGCLSYELCLDRARRRRLLWVFLLSSTSASMNALVQLATGHDWVKHYSIDHPGRFVRAQGSLKSPNDLAAFLLWSLPLSFYIWFREKKWNAKSFCLAGLLVLQGVIFILTLSRGAFFSMLSAAALYLIFSKQWKRLAALLAVFAPIVTASDVLFQNFISSLNLKDITIVERTRMWLASWEMIRQKPLLGWGVNTFTENFSVMRQPGRIYHGYAHNCYLQMWAEIGIGGLLAFLWPFAIYMRKSNERKSEKSGVEDALWTGLTAYLLQSFVDTNFYGLQTVMLFWFLWGLYLAVSISSSKS